MSPIENVAPNHVDVVADEVKLRNKPDRSRDLFGVQLEVCNFSFLRVCEGGWREAFNMPLARRKAVAGQPKNARIQTAH